MMIYTGPCRGGAKGAIWPGPPTLGGLIRPKIVSSFAKKHKIWHSNVVINGLRGPLQI